MKSLILYTTGTQAPDQVRVNGYLKAQTIIVKGKPVYIRPEIFDGHFEEALLAARPFEGETVLNTIPFE